MLFKCIQILNCNIYKCIFCFLIALLVSCVIISWDPEVVKFCFLHFSLELLEFIFVFGMKKEHLYLVLYGWLLSQNQLWNSPSLPHWHVMIHLFWNNISCKSVSQLSSYPLVHVSVIAPRPHSYLIILVLEWTWYPMGPVFHFVLIKIVLVILGLHFFH